MYLEMYIFFIRSLVSKVEAPQVNDMTAVCKMCIHIIIMNKYLISLPPLQHSRDATHPSGLITFMPAHQVIYVRVIYTIQCFYFR